MKYKVIGWTYYDNSDILSSGNTIGFAERNAIIDEIRKHKYLFTGWHHQESWDGVVPILNDGMKRCFSQRGWGGVMAEAYEQMGDFDYAGFTFYESLDSSEIKYAPELDYIKEEQVEAVENEHFIVEVNEGLFEIAKKSNPFYLEDLDELRYIDSNDMITLKCNNEELTFVVQEIDRCRTKVGSRTPKKYIKGEYEIIVKHKPESERKLSKKHRILSRSSAFELFKEAMEEYDYDLIEEIVNRFYINYVAEKLPKTKTRKNLTRFVKEFIEKDYVPQTVIHILKYLNNYKLFEEIAEKTLDKNKTIYISFIEHYLEDKRNMDEHILKFVDTLKTNEQLYAGSIDILLKGINLRPNNKVLRKYCYKVIKGTRYEDLGLPLMTGLNLFKSLRKQDKEYLQLDNYQSFREVKIREIVEYLTYPKTGITEESYVYHLPKIYEHESQIIHDGLKVYQDYMKNHFDLDSILEKMMMKGIDKSCSEMEQYLDGERHAANYVYTLDMLTDYKYNLKEKALEKYASNSEDFSYYIDRAYNKK